LTDSPRRNDHAVAVVNGIAKMKQCLLSGLCVLNARDALP